MKFSNEEMLAMYKTMVLAREYSYTIEQGSLDGKIGGRHHLGVGEEAISTAVCYALGKDDWIIPQQRWQAAYLTGPGKDVDLKKFMAEHCGRETGYYHGLCCDMHIANVEHHMLMNNCMMGTNYAIGTGFAKALKTAGKGQVVVAGAGDASFNEGLVYEAFEIGADLELPIVYVISDNGWGSSYSSKRYKRPLGERADAFGIPSVRVDGSDLLAIREALDNAVALARQGKPNLVHCYVTRLGSNFAGSNDDFRYAYDDPAEIEDAKKNKDCIKNHEAILFERNIIDEKESREIKEKIKADVEEAFQEALAAKVAGRELVLDKTRIYVNPWEGNEA